MKKERKVISLIIAIISAVIMVAADPPRRYKFTTFLGMLVFGSIIYGIAYFIVGLFLNSESGINLQNKINAKKEEEELKSATLKNLNEYEDFKKSFVYFSNEKLTSLYESHLNSGKEDMERLALEETLVERGLLNHSPMHEKLHLLKKKFNL
tara:strand:+ start:462 stop:917 length:456 start_codon:yes stop_codon:yes gene_type:complete